MLQLNQFKQVVAEFRNTIAQIGTMSDDEFDKQFHGILWNIEKLSQISSTHRKDLMAGFMSESQTLESGIMCHHSRTKPLGYAGDHLIIDMIYQHAVADTEVGRLVDEFFHRQLSPTAVRNRKQFFIETFGDLCRRKNAPSVLDIACGPCRDVAEALVELGSLSDNAKFHCVDMDPRAISYAQKIVPPQKSRNIKWQATNAFRLKTDKKHDLVWSAGLFDYLDDRVAAFLLRKMWHATEYGGEVIIGNFHSSNPDRPWMEWCGDWHLIHRNEEEMLNICNQAGIPIEVANFHYEPTKINMFLKLTKV